jgi:hypothetical protein
MNHKTLRIWHINMFQITKIHSILSVIILLIYSFVKRDISLLGNNINCEVPDSHGSEDKHDSFLERYVLKWCRNLSTFQ